MKPTHVYTVRRVSYGSSKTLKHMREYQEHVGGPVGCRDEILPCAKRAGFTHVQFIESDGTSETLEVQ